jgi:hypothetical protein
MEDNYSSSTTTEQESPKLEEFMARPKVAMAIKIFTKNCTTVFDLGDKLVYLTLYSQVL